MNALEKRNQALFDELVASPDLKAKVTFSNVVAIALAMFVNCLPLMVAALALNFIVRAINERGTTISVWYIFFAVLLFPLIWALRPRIYGKRPAQILPREKAPALYNLVDRVADRLHVAPVEGIYFSDRYNASILRYELKSGYVLELGIPLWYVLTDQERVALIAHELAHEANGDFAYVWILNTARRSLEIWYRSLAPRVAVPGMFFLFAAFLAEFIRGVHYVLTRLMTYDLRRAEFLADSRAAYVAGTDNALAGLLKVGFAFEYIEFLRRLFQTGRLDNHLSKFRDFLENLTSEQKIKLSRLIEEKERLYVWTHPSMEYRLKFLQAKPVTRIRASITEEESKSLAAEFAPFAQRLDEHYATARKNPLYFG